MARRRLRAMIDSLHIVTSDDLLNSKQFTELVMKETPNAITDALSRKSVYATLFEINNSSHHIEIHKKDWKAALDACLEYYASPEKEDYDMCLEIKKLSEKINSQKTKKEEHV